MLDLAEEYDQNHGNWLFWIFQDRPHKTTAQTYSSSHGCVATCDFSAEINPPNKTVVAAPSTAGRERARESARESERERERGVALKEADGKR